jgi:hypothetical protein
LKTKLLFLLFICGNLTLLSQDYLTTTQSNALVLKHTSRELSARGGDSLNVIPTWVDPSIPFLDDFSTDKRRPNDFSSFLNGVTSSYYINGQCVEHKKYKRGKYKFSTRTTYVYFFKPGASPDFVDSSLNSSLNISVFNDIPNCIVAQNISLFPATTRYTFTSTGIVKDSSFIFDTIISCAFIQEITLKGYQWVDRHSYFNSHLPYFPPSKGVATLDGLNQYGRPYDTIGKDVDGIADYLTTVPFDFSTKTFADSIYLSFLYQAQGLGDYPDKKDSLVVEFYDDRGLWQTIWAKAGFNSNEVVSIDSMVFKRVMIQIPRQIVLSDPNYFHDSFMFRFKNYATISGNNDHWHIDYVKLDEGRNLFDTTIKDANFVYELPSVLKDYTLMPSKQYRGIQDLKDTIIGWNRNILPAPIVSFYKYQCKNENSGTIYGQNNTGIPYSANPIVPLYLKPISELNYPTAIQDSTYITTKVFIDPSDIYTSNDTASHRQFFFNEMAYDDGSAEMAYGIEGVGTKKVAYRFVLPKKDTLAAIKILFSNIDYPVFNLFFNFNIWTSIGMHGKTERIIKTITNKKPLYRDSINGFVTFGLDTPLEVQDTIYVGWTQSDERNIQIGYDRNNTNGLNNTFVFLNNIWSKSNIVNNKSNGGSPMIRLILDGKRNYRGSNTAGEITIQKDEKISFYPNPVSDFLSIDAPDYSEKEMVIYDMLGKTIYKTAFKSSLKTDLSLLNNGFYIIHFIEKGKLIQSEKLQIYR